MKNLRKINNKIDELKAAIELLDQWKLMDDERAAENSDLPFQSDFMRDLTHDKFAAVNILKDTGFIAVGITLDEDGQNKWMGVIL